MKPMWREAFSEKSFFPKLDESFYGGGRIEEHKIRLWTNVLFLIAAQYPGFSCTLPRPWRWRRRLCFLAYIIASGPILKRNFSEEVLSYSGRDYQEMNKPQSGWAQAFYMMGTSASSSSNTNKTTHRPTRSIIIIIIIISIIHHPYHPRHGDGNDDDDGDGDDDDRIRIGFL